MIMLQDRSFFSHCSANSSFRVVIVVDQKFIVGGVISWFLVFQIEFSLVLLLSSTAVTDVYNNIRFPLFKAFEWNFSPIMFLKFVSGLFFFAFRFQSCTMFIDISLHACNSLDLLKKTKLTWCSLLTFLFFISNFQYSVMNSFNIHKDTAEISFDVKFLLQFFAELVLDS